GGRRAHRPGPPPDRGHRGLPGVVAGRAPRRRAARPPRPARRRERAGAGAPAPGPDRRPRRPLVVPGRPVRRLLRRRPPPRRRRPRRLGSAAPDPRRGERRGPRVAPVAPVTFLAPDTDAYVASVVRHLPEFERLTGRAASVRIIDSDRYFSNDIHAFLTGDEPADVYMSGPVLLW